MSVAHESLHTAVNSALEPYPTYPYSSVHTLGTFDGGGVCIFRTNFYYYYIYPFLFYVSVVS